MIIKLDYDKARNYIVNREKFMTNNELGNKSYRMLTGTPVVVSVEGTYVKADDIPNIMADRRYLMEVNRWLIELRNPQVQTGHFTVLNFVWERSN